MDRIRVGIIGCGLAAQICHLPYLQELSELFEISALCDLSSDLVNILGDKYGVSLRYRHYQDLLDQDIDAIFVLTRDHFSITVDALDSGKHVLVEKPLAFNLEQADKMIKKARHHDRKLMVGYMKRFDPSFERACKLINEMEKIGIIRLHCSVGLPSRQVSQMQNIINPKDISSKILEQARHREREAIYEALSNHGEQSYKTYYLLLQLWSHDINLLRAAFGEPDYVCPVEARVLKGVSDPPGLTQLLALFGYGPNTSCVWESQAFVAHEEWDEELALFGIEKTIRLNFPLPYLKNTPSVLRIEETTNGEIRKQKIIVSFDEAYKRELIHFHDCIVNNTEPRTNGMDAMKDIELALKIVEKIV